MGETKWDLDRYTMKFDLEEGKFALEGILIEANLKWIYANKLSKSPYKQSQIAYMQLCSLEGQDVMNVLTIEEQEKAQVIQDVLLEHHDVFEEPKGLLSLPVRDHCIPLKEGIVPVNIWPYRYSTDQKNSHWENE